MKYYLLNIVNLISF